MAVVEIAAFDSSGAPLAGLSPGWLSFRDAATGADHLGTAPAVTAVGHKYKFTPPTSYQYAGILDLNAGGGAAATERYALVVGDGPVYVFAAFASAGGAPDAAATPAWYELYDADSGSNILGSAPSIAAVGDGMFRFTPPSGVHLSGSVDVGAGHAPRYEDVDAVGFGTGAGGGAMVVDNVSPSGGSALADRATPISFGLYSNAAAISLVVVTVRYASKAWTWVAWDGGEFRYPFDSEVSAVTGTGAPSDEFVFTLLPRLGWPDDVQEVRVLAVDQAGNVLDRVV